MRSVREAKEFLASQIAEEAQREGTPLSEMSARCSTFRRLRLADLRPRHDLLKLFLTAMAIVAVIVSGIHLGRKGLAISLQRFPAHLPDLVIASVEFLRPSILSNMVYFLYLFYP